MGIEQSKKSCNLEQSTYKCCVQEKTATVLSTDIKKSSTLWMLHTDKMKDAILLHNAILETIILNNQGIISDQSPEGDAYIALFDNKETATTTAKQIQYMLKYYRNVNVHNSQTSLWFDGGIPQYQNQIFIRIGIASGNVCKNLFTRSTFDGQDVEDAFVWTGQAVKDSEEAESQSKIKAWGEEDQPVGMFYNSPGSFETIKNTTHIPNKYELERLLGEIQNKYKRFIENVTEEVDVIGLMMFIHIEQGKKIQQFIKNLKKNFKEGVRVLFAKEKRDFTMMIFLDYNEMKEKKLDIIMIMVYLSIPNKDVYHIGACESNTDSLTIVKRSITCQKNNSPSNKHCVDFFGTAVNMAARMLHPPETANKHLKQINRNQSFIRVSFQNSIRNINSKFKTINLSDLNAGDTGVVNVITLLSDTGHIQFV
jgi:hypothetical protein